MNALTTLVTKYLKSNNLTCSQLAQSAGYSNINKGLRSLEQYCLTLKDTNNISHKLKKILNIPDPEFENTVNQVQSKIELKKRGTFLPSIQIIPSSRPSVPIFVLAMVPSLMNIQVPDITACSFEQELQIIFNAYKKHQLQHYSKIYEGSDYEELIQIVEKLEQDGKIYPWTIAKGYRYFRTYETTLIFNRYGVLIDNDSSKKITTSIKNDYTFFNFNFVMDDDI